MCNSQGRGPEISDIRDIREIVLKEVLRCVRDSNQEVYSATILIGDGGLFDSILLIELCVGLEDRSSELGFEFDWTSDSAMSNSRSIFLSVETLSTEFYRQLEARA